MYAPRSMCAAGAVLQCLTPSNKERDGPCLAEDDLGAMAVYLWDDSLVKGLHFQLGLVTEDHDADAPFVAVRSARLQRTCGVWRG